MKRFRTGADFGLYKNLKANKRKCILVLCSSSVAVLSFILIVVYLVVLVGEAKKIPNGVIASNAQIFNSKHPGRPFEVQISGIPPKEFTPTTSTVLPTTKKPTTVSYPQINHYSQHQYPKSIQEIIDYVTDKPENNFINIGEEMRGSLYPSFTQLPKNDFKSFRPDDPSEVNLLATGSVRFAPPVWRNYQRFNHKPIPINSYIDNSNIPLHHTIRTTKNPFTRLPENTDTLATVKKPLMVSINISPMEHKHPHHLENTKKDAMTLNLKVFPDMAYFDEEGTQITQY